MSLRTVIVAFGCLGAIVALVLLGTNITNTAVGGAVDCGSAFQPKVDQLREDAQMKQATDVFTAAFEGKLSFEAVDYSAVTECGNAINTRQTIGWIVFGVCAAAAAGAVLTRKTSPPAPPVAAA